MDQERQKNWLTFLFRDTSWVAVAIVCSSLVCVGFERIVVGIDAGSSMGTVELEAHEDDSQAHTDQSDRDDGQVEVSGEQETDEQISASVIQYGTSAGLQFFRHPRHLLGFTLSPAIT